MATPAGHGKSVFQSGDQTVLQRCFCWFLHLDPFTSSVEQPQLNSSSKPANGLHTVDADVPL